MNTNWWYFNIPFLEDWAEVSNCGGTMVDKKKTLFHGDETIEENLRYLNLLPVFLL